MLPKSLLSRDKCLPAITGFFGAKKRGSTYKHIGHYIDTEDWEKKNPGVKKSNSNALSLNSILSFKRSEGSKRHFPGKLLMPMVTPRLPQLARSGKPIGQLQLIKAVSSTGEKEIPRLVNIFLKLRQGECIPFMIEQAKNYVQVAKNIEGQE